MKNILLVLGGDEDLSKLAKVLQAQGYKVHCVERAQDAISILQLKAWTLASELLARRIDLGYTQVELAKRLGVTQSKVSRMETQRLRTPDWVLEKVRTLPKVGPTRRMATRRGPQQRRYR